MFFPRFFFKFYKLHFTFSFLLNYTAVRGFTLSDLLLYKSRGHRCFPFSPPARVMYNFFKTVYSYTPAGFPKAALNRFVLL